MRTSLLSTDLGLTPTRSKGGRFNLAAFMAAQSDGFWYDFTKTDRLFQENFGPTPADDPNEVIGLALSSRLWNGATLAQVLAAAPELVSNGDFSSATGWTTGANWTIGSGKATKTAGAANNLTATATTPAVGRTYRVEFTVSNYGGSGAVTPTMGANGTTRTANGTYVEYITATGSTSFALAGDTSFSGDIDNVSVKEVSRYPATQATTNYKPKFQSSGAAFDGTDDYLATSYAAAAGANFVMLPKVTVPATLSALKVLTGTLNASSYRFYLGMTAAGQLSGRIGTTIVETTTLDLRNGVHDIGMWTDGANIFLYADGVIVASGILSGVIPTSAWNIGALNNNGTPTNFFGGSLKAALAGRQALTVPQANNICAAY